MKRTEYIKLKQQIESESHRKLEALELIWNMSKEPDETTHTKSTQTNGTKNNGKDFNASHAIRTVIKQLWHNPFRNRDIQELLEKRYQDNTIETNYISWIMRDLRKKHKIERIDGEDSNRRTGFVYIKKGRQMIHLTAHEEN